MKDYKRSGKKVLVKDGMTYFERAVYVTDYGERFFKHDGKKRYIYKTTFIDGSKGYYSPLYNGVHFIEE